GPANRVLRGRLARAGRLFREDRWMPLKIVWRGGVAYLRGSVGPAGRRQRIYESTGAREQAVAEEYRVQREKELWGRIIHGARATVTFAAAAASYLEHTKPAPGDARRVDRLVAWFGPHTKLKDVDQGALDRCCAQMLKREAANGTKLRAVYIPVTAILRH